MRFLSQGQWTGFWRRPRLPAEELRQYQGQRLAALVRFAAHRVPFYRQRFREAGLDPDRIGGLSDLERIPRTTKAELQLAPFEDRLAPGTDPARCIERRTSGSCGQPIRILRSPAEERLLLAFRLRAQLQLGLRPRDRRVAAGFSDITPFLPHRLGLLPISVLEPFLPPAAVIRELRRAKPDVLRIRADLLHDVVRQAAPGELGDVGARLVFCGAALTSRGLRDEAAAGFGCPVIDFYGAHEINLIAFECLECGSYHTIDDSVIVEALKDGRPAEPGERGEVHVTALHSRTMPFIRYSWAISRRGPPARATAAWIQPAGLHRGPPAADP